MHSKGEGEGFEEGRMTIGMRGTHAVSEEMHAWQLVDVGGEGTQEGAERSLLRD